MAFPWKEVLSAAAVIGSGLLTYFSQKKAQERSNEAARENAAYGRELSSGLTGSEIQQFQLNAAEAQKTRDWQKQQMLEGPSWQMQGYQDAGLNPALMYQNGLSFPAAGNMARADATNVSTPQTFGLDLSNVAAMALNALKLPSEIRLNQEQAKKAQADAVKAEADARLSNANASMVEIAAKYEDDIKRLQKEGMELANNLTKKQEDKIDQDIKESVAREHKAYEEAKTEEEKRNAYAAEVFLKRAQANEIVALQPFKQALLEAQEEEARGVAANQFAHAAHEKGLLDMGIVEQEFRQAYEGAEASEIANEWNRYQISLKDGSYWGPDPNDSKWNANRKKFMRKLSFTMSYIGNNMPFISGVSGHLHLGTNSSESSSSSNGSSAGSYSARGSKD